MRYEKVKRSDGKTENATKRQTDDHMDTTEPIALPRYLYYVVDDSGHVRLRNFMTSLIDSDIIGSETISQ